MKKLKPYKVDWAQIERFLASADKKLASAHKILAFDEEACLQQAYEAMLKASLGFMFSHSFRARSQPGHHIAIIDFGFLFECVSTSLKRTDSQFWHRGGRLKNDSLGRVLRTIS